MQWLARRRDWALQGKIQVSFCRLMLAIIGVKVETSGEPAGSSPRFVVANHVSWTDILALASVMPLVFLAKKEVSGWPVLGFLARLQGTIFVERENRRAIPIVNAALGGVMRAGRDVVVFAEGTSSDGSTVLKFNAAHFAMLSDLQHRDDPLPFTLAPACIVYAVRSAGLSKPADVGWYGDMSFLPHLWSLMKRGDVVCRIAFGQPVETAGLDRKALAAATEAAVRELFEVASPREAAPAMQGVAR